MSEIVSENIVNEKKKDTNPVTRDLDVFFDKLITKGEMTTEVKLKDGLTIEMKALSTWDTLMAEARIPLGDFINGAVDVANRARAISVLAVATVSVNGIDIKQNSLTDVENGARVDEVYKKYLNLPPLLLDKLIEEYTNLQKKQMDFYQEPKKISEELENF